MGFLVARYGGLIADWGAAFRGSRDVALARDISAIGSLVRRRTLVSLLLGTAYVVGTLALGEHQLLPLVAVVAAAGLSRDWVALGRERGLRSGLPFAVRGAVLLAGSAFVGSLARAALLVGLAYASSLLVSLGANPLPRRRKGGTGASVSADAWMLLAVVMAQLYTSLDTVLLAALRSAREAGVYSAVYRLPLAVVTVVGLVVSGMLPITSRLLTSGTNTVAALRHRILRISGPMGLLVGLAGLPAMIMVRPLLGPQYTSGRLPLMLLLVATGVATASAPIGALFVSVGDDRTYAVVLTIGAVVNVVGNLALIPTLGMNGAAGMTVASEVVVLVLLLALLQRCERLNGS